MTRTEESLGGLVNRARISSAEARFPSAKTAFMISRSRRVRAARCDMCRILDATVVACHAAPRRAPVYRPVRLPAPRARAGGSRSADPSTAIFGIVERRGAGVDRLRPDQSAVAKLFEAMRRPAEDAADREGRREQIRRQTQAVQQQGRVELDVGIEPPVRLTLAEQAE